MTFYCGRSSGVSAKGLQWGAILGGYYVDVTVLASEGHPIVEVLLDQRYYTCLYTNS